MSVAMVMATAETAMPAISEHHIDDLATHPTKFVTVPALAAYWGVSRKKIYRDADKGCFPGALQVGHNGPLRIPTTAARQHGRPYE